MSCGRTPYDKEEKTVKVMSRIRKSVEKSDGYMVRLKWIPQTQNILTPEWRNR